MRSWRRNKLFAKQSPPVNALGSKQAKCKCHRNPPPSAPDGGFKPVRAASQTILARIRCRATALAPLRPHPVAHNTDSADGVNTSSGPWCEWGERLGCGWRAPTPSCSGCACGPPACAVRAAFPRARRPLPSCPAAATRSAPWPRFASWKTSPNRSLSRRASGGWSRSVAAKVSSRKSPGTSRRARALKPTLFISSRSRMPPSMIVLTQPSARWMLLLTSPQNAPITRGLSRSCTTTIFGPGTLPM